MKIYKVYFTNPSKRTSREIGKGRNLGKAQSVIYKFLEKNHYKASYWRHWHDNYGYWYDVGSWSECFNIKKEVI